MKSASIWCFAVLVWGCGTTKENTEPAQSKTERSCDSACHRATEWAAPPGVSKDEREAAVAKCTLKCSKDKRFSTILFTIVEKCVDKIPEAEDSEACRQITSSIARKKETRSKTTEAIDNLDKIYKGAAFYYTAPKVGKDGRKLPCQFPVDQAVTPSGKTCCASLGSAHDQDKDGRCDANPEHWNSPTWAALSFQINDQHYFTYAFDWNGKTLSEARFTASAYADLDCDGEFSTFQRLGYGDPQATMSECALRGTAAFYVENETE